MFSSTPNAKVLEIVAHKIAPYIHKTPVLHSQAINKIAGAKIFFKCENFQKVGAFKFRGATNAILSLTKSQKKQGVATHSSGNHAQALALAAKQAGIKAYIVMPENSPQVKKEAVLAYGAEITFCESNLAARETTLAQVIKKTNAHFVHPYDDYRIIAGQATAAMEFQKQTPNLDFLLAPVGGGGLLSGTALASHYFSPKTKVFGAEPLEADDAFRSLEAGVLIPVENPQTIADGLRTSLSQKTFQIINKHIEQIIRVEEREISAAMRLIWERVKIIVEPSSAVPLAAVLKRKSLFRNKKVGIILTGGNVDLRCLPF